MAKEIKLYTTDHKLKWRLIPPFSLESFVLSASFSEDKGIFGCVASNGFMYFWENTITLKLFKSVQCSNIQTGIWYLPIHKTWITAGKNASKEWVLREWEVTNEGGGSCK
jgi:WD40 repeat protein